jgi:hypothetical protein
MMWVSLKGAQMDVQEVADRLEIQELLAKYARGVDRKQFELWKDVFTADAVLDYSNVGHAPGPRDEVIAYFAAALAHVPMTQHFVSNVEYEFAADGNSANVTAMFYNPMQLPGMADLSYCGGYYHHRFVRTADGWRSVHVAEENSWFVNRPPARGA